MKQTFHATVVSNPFDDPFIYIRIIREKRALLFDLGDIKGIESGNLLRVSDIFVTHTHMDHFIGFDMLLRILLRRDSPLKIFGPEGIIGCIEGKLRGYAWNLIKDYPIKIDVFEIKGRHIYHSGFYAENSFVRTDNPPSEFNEVLLKDSLFTIKGLILTHQIPVMAFSLKEDFHININKEILSEMGLPVGPWLSDFKKALRKNYDNNKKRLIQCEHPEILEINGIRYPIDELMRIATITKGQQISYVMDISPTDENIEKLIPFIKDSDYLFCEAYFLEKDRERAIGRHHLTAADAGRLAREAGVGNLIVTHFSPRYINCPEDIYNEAMKEFQK